MSDYNYPDPQYYFERPEPESKRSGNRTFLGCIGLLGVILLAALTYMAAYLIYIRPHNLAAAPGNAESKEAKLAVQATATSLVATRDTLLLAITQTQVVAAQLTQGTIPAVGLAQTGTAVPEAALAPATAIPLLLTVPAAGPVDLPTPSDLMGYPPPLATQPAVEVPPASTLVSVEPTSTAIPAAAAMDTLVPTLAPPVGSSPTEALPSQAPVIVLSTPAAPSATPTGSGLPSSPTPLLPTSTPLPPTSAPTSSRNTPVFPSPTATLIPSIRTQTAVLQPQAGLSSTATPVHPAATQTALPVRAAATQTAVPVQATTSRSITSLLPTSTLTDIEAPTATVAALLTQAAAPDTPEPGFPSTSNTQAPTTHTPAPTLAATATIQASTPAAATSTQAPTSAAAANTPIPTLAAAANTQAPAQAATAAASATSTATAQPSPTAAVLPRTGFANEAGIPGLMGLALAMLIVIVIARGLRTRTH